jgi:hypothetical protein
MTKCPRCGCPGHLVQLNKTQLNKIKRRYRDTCTYGKMVLCRKSIGGHVIKTNNQGEEVRDRCLTWRVRATAPGTLPFCQHSHLYTLFCFRCGQVIESKIENIRKKASLRWKPF